MSALNENCSVCDDVIPWCLLTQNYICPAEVISQFVPRARSFRLRRSLVALIAFRRIDNERIDFSRQVYYKMRTANCLKVKRSALTVLCNDTNALISSQSGIAWQVHASQTDIRAFVCRLAVVADNTDPAVQTITNWTNLLWWFSNGKIDLIQTQCNPIQMNWIEENKTPQPQSIDKHLQWLPACTLHRHSQLDTNCSFLSPMCQVSIWEFSNI